MALHMLNLGTPATIAASAGNAVGAVKGVGSAFNNLSSNGAVNNPAPLIIKLQLGEFIFQDMEVPEVLPFHGTQKLAVKEMVGGVRDVQALGDFNDPISFSGTIFPTVQLSAIDRARQLELMRKQGQPLDLTWDTQHYKVYIADFKPDYRFARIPYSITLVVLQDMTEPMSGILNPTVDDAVGSGMDALTSLIAQIVSITNKLNNLSSSVLTAITSIESLIGAVKTALYSASGQIGSASSASPSWNGTSSTTGSTATGTVNSAATGSTTLAGATASQVNPIIQTVVAASNAIASLSASVDASLSGFSGFGGVAAGQMASVSATALQSALSLNQLQVALVQMTSTLAVMLTNLQSINASLRTITVSGGNLYAIAAQQYGDASAADLIMEANKLLDPQITGIVTLIIPPYNATAANGGILSV